MPREGLLSQILVFRADLNQGYAPQILPTPALNPICIGDVNRQTVGTVTQGDHLAILIVLHCVVDASRRRLRVPDVRTGGSPSRQTRTSKPWSAPTEPVQRHSNAVEP